MTSRSELARSVLQGALCLGLLLAFWFVLDAPRSAHADRRARLTATQRRRIQLLHRRPPPDLLREWLHLPLPPLVLVPIGQRTRHTLTPSSAEGGFDAISLHEAELAFAYRQDGSTHPIHPRLLDLVYQAARRLRAPYVHVVSGYRPTSATSRHGQGRAVDVVFPGLPDRRVAAHFRTQGFVGVGIYPQSGFVHVDVRARSYFWSDSSLPDQPAREHSILRTIATRYDRLARRRGVDPRLEEAPHGVPGEEQSELTQVSGGGVVDEEPASVTSDAAISQNLDAGTAE